MWKQTTATPLVPQNTRKCIHAHIHTTSLHLSSTKKKMKKHAARIQHHLAPCYMATSTGKHSSIKRIHPTFTIITNKFIYGYMKSMPNMPPIQGLSKPEDHTHTFQCGSQIDSGRLTQIQNLLAMLNATQQQQIKSTSGHKNHSVIIPLQQRVPRE